MFLLFDGVGKLAQLAPVRQSQMLLGYPEALTSGIGMVLLASTIVYLIPQTSILGAILLTAYLGGATASQLRIAGPFWFPIVFAVFIWTALFLRDGRLRRLVPIRRPPANE
jgi:DoxX-like protein